MKNNYSRLKWMALIIIVGIFFFLSKTANAATSTLPLFQQQEVSGVVQDQNGLPIPGVTVTVKNTNRGTVTNLDGEYTINAPANGTLIFSYLGYKTVEIPVDNNEEISIQLEEDIAALGEVKINAGYYNTTERERTGNISRVTEEEIENQPVVSPLQALQGRMAGVEVTSGGSHPGMAPTIRIRGTNSLREEGNYPLYIIDGVPINATPVESNSLLGNTGIDPLNNLNVSNIESIEVLKDADATAIYGSRGANGVVLITTKKGGIGKIELEAKAYTGISTVPNRLDLLSTPQYIQIREKAFENDDTEPTESNAYDLLIWDQNRYTDWQEFLFGGNSPVTDLNLSASGGSENTSFRIGSSYHNQGTVYPGAYDYSKFTAGFNLNHISDDKKLDINLSVNYGEDINKSVGNVDLSSGTFRLPPNAPSVFNEDGSLHWEEWTQVGLNNPLQGFYNNSETQTTRLNANLGVSYQIIAGLRFKANLGYTSYHSEELLKIPKKSYNPSSWESTENRSSHFQSNRKSYIIEPQLVYSDKIGEGKIDALLGVTFQKSMNSRLGIQGLGYVAEALIGNLDAAETTINGTSRNIEYKYNAVFARLGYNLKEKYYINLTGRRDGSSRFGPGKRFANFGAVGAAWLFLEEPFLKDRFSFLSFGKVRSSYGTTGSDQIGDYGYLDAYEATSGPGGIYPVQLSNPDYSWEVNKKLEAAIELGFVQDRINVGVSWYRNRSSNQLVGYALPAMTGFTSVQANLPATVQNTGWEIEVSSRNISSNDFTWQSSFNFTLPKNKLLSYPDIEQSSYVNTYRVGHPLDISLLYQYEGIDTETGLYKVTDINEDGSFDYEDRVVIQDRTRSFYGGLNNNLNYKNFSLQFLFDFVKQEGSIGSLFNAGTLNNQRSEVMQALDNGSRFQRISRSLEASSAYSRVLLSGFPLEDASFLRLKTISLGYTLPADIMQVFGARSCKLFLSGQNLFVITSYSGMDPELPGLGTSFAALRTVSGGVQLNF
ncbi:TonB-linked outer membrane protein, SusC/RagA family [Salegentibacter echinorum]|uniref:TonB-linked outer membrane protein, SusC/RagA family n=1 Tax=Salegentibacter echinorum TaxID=1073325 RepID=A0A1M5MAC3_SALEC|nr:TonB-dependent receptor [Salegentibacter echinorum]SHG74228.1 TonB-linked outer membrane protein, SusC/RagA family [Salegentibacter echinorum]